MAKLILADRNYIPSSTLAGGSYSVSLPLSNCKERPFSKIARTTDATSGSTYFTVDYGSPQTTQLLSLLRHNIIQVSSRIRIRASNDAGATTNLLYDTGSITIIPSVYDWLTHDFYENNWFYGEPYAEDLELFTRQFIHITPQPIRARYWRIDITDTTNSDGYIQFGYFFAAPIFRGTVDIQLGSSLSFLDNTGIQESIGGVEYFDIRKKPRVLVVGFKGLSKNEALSNLFNMAQRRGKNELIYIIPDSTDLLNMNKEAFIGRLSEMPQFSDFTFGFYQVSTALKEVF